MATNQSQNQRLLVLRERNAPLPNLNDAKMGQVSSRGALHQDVTVVSQFDDEIRTEFCARVLSRIALETQHDVAYRAIVVSIADCIDGDEAEARRRMVHALVQVLALRPHGGLVFVAPATAGASLRTALLELAESAACSAPHLNVRVSFSGVQPAKLRGKSTERRSFGHAA